MSATRIDASKGTLGGTSLAWRALIAVAVLAVNKLLLNHFVDFPAAEAATGAGSYLRILQHWGLRFLVTLAAAIAVFGYVQGNERLRILNAQVRGGRLRFGWLIVHLALFVPLALLALSLYGNHGVHLALPVLALLGAVVGMASLLALLAALAPLGAWRAACVAIGRWWLYAAAIAVAALLAVQWSQSLWGPTARITFELVAWVLRPVIPGLHAEPSTQVLDTGRFAIQVNSLCSGLEGAGLLLAFCCAWLFFFRREYRFPRALMVIPVGLFLMFLLNVLRISVLVLIGHLGYPAIALNGFHSQAGWIAFNATAGGIAYTSRRTNWLSRAAEPETAVQADNPTAAYLLPMLTILAAGMLGRAASGGFETWYALRLVCVVPVIWMCRKHWRALDFRFSWRGALAGAAVFGIWVLAARLLLPGHPLPRELASMSLPMRTLWITSRLLASTTTVPIAEELAYRGYLMRRIRNRDFEGVRFADSGPWALLASSIVFGLGHGPMWPAGIVAGTVYGLVLMRTGRIGESIAAHAVTNGLVGATVLWGNQWQLW
jgi:exosortase E/protease (VPEID-CTERM system)